MNSFWRTRGVLLAALMLFASADAAAEQKIVLLAGDLDDHPRGTHEYEKSVTLLQHILETSPNVNGVTTEAHFHGWPEDPSTLDDADTIVVISGGSDQNLTDHPLMVAGRLAYIDKQMKRGCGLVLIHWTTFAPRDMAGDYFLEWIGGYFDYESGPPPRNWYSAIRTARTEPYFPTPDHPISRGLNSFELNEEYYYKIRFRENDPRLSAIMKTPIPEEPDEQVVAWAVERDDGGRGFGFTGGHFFDNYFIDEFRTMILNAVLWTARADVPEGGVEASTGDRMGGLILTGPSDPFHDRAETSAAIKRELSADPRMVVVVVDIVDETDLGTMDLSGYGVIVQNYANWERPSLSEAAKTKLLDFVENGGGLVVVHFANGAFHYSLPGAEESDWPAYRELVRRVWNHNGNSGHDPYGEFTVEITDVEHPITAGMEDYATTDELYFNQDGDEPIVPLIESKSNITGKNEPLAWAYDFGEGRVFQTLLGHNAKSLTSDGTAILLRRGTAWAAKRLPLEAEVPD